MYWQCSTNLPYCSPQEHFWICLNFLALLWPLVFFYHILECSGVRLCCPKTGECWSVADSTGRQTDSGISQWMSGLLHPEAAARSPRCGRSLVVMSLSLLAMDLNGKNSLFHWQRFGVFWGFFFPARRLLKEKGWNTKQKLVASL